MKAAQRRTIAILEANQNVFELVCEYFGSQDFQVVRLTDPALAIETSRASSCDWDVLIIDCQLMHQTESSFIDTIKGELPGLPIIFFGRSDCESAIRIKLGKDACDLISSPVQLAHLILAVEQALGIKRDQFDTPNRSQLDKATILNLIKSHKLVGSSPKFLATISLAKRAAPSSANILIFGESGTGKEVVAKFIHDESKQKKGPFVAINCSAIPENLLESELFGHAKGSFTGALEKRIGLFEAAENGTLFLDEIGDLNLSLQAKLLRVLQEKKIKRVGENQDRPINCRVISATHKDLIHEVLDQHFREDLFFRLNVIPIVLPPLRERAEDILPLAEAFLEKYSKFIGSRGRFFSESARAFLTGNRWRGNVRELENAVERAVVLSKGVEINAEDFLPPLESEFGFSKAGSRLDDEGSDGEDGETSSTDAFKIECPGFLPKLDEVIREYIAYAVRKNGGARDKTAREIGIDRKTLYKKIQSDPPETP